MARERENTARREREALKFNCPYCLAGPGEPCVNQRDSVPLKRPHPERIKEARNAA